MSAVEPLPTVQTPPRMDELKTITKAPPCSK